MVNKGNTKYFNEIRDFLNERYLKYNQKSFIENDPICIPHLFHKKEDIEITAFLIATIAWGNRKSIISNGNKLMHWMDFKPHEFILHHSKKDLIPFKKFVHRTFNGSDCIFFIESLKNIYTKHHGLEAAFGSSFNCKENIINFRNIFLEQKHLPRSEKHISNPLKNSSAKRLCMFLRWMVRKDNCGVDFGIWNNISPSSLCLPLDVHTGNVSRQLKLLTRTQNDWQAVEEITSVLKTFDANDPIKYDFALFGIGVNKELEN
jgi:uncharacterized protein (TIGR02757 family)